MMARILFGSFLLLCAWTFPVQGVQTDEVTTLTSSTEQSPPPETESSETQDSSDDAADAETRQQPWDYLPYRVLVWVASENPRVNASTLSQPLREFLDRDFASVWRTEVRDAPPAVTSAATRDLDGMDYDTITAADPILAVRRDHPDAVRIRVAKNVGKYVDKVYATSGMVGEVKRRAEQVDNPTIDGTLERMEVIDGDAMAVKQLWQEEDTEALLISRGMAVTLDDPEAKLIPPTIDGLVTEVVEDYDKIFVVHVPKNLPADIRVVEIDVLMRHFGPVAAAHAPVLSSLASATGHAVSDAFAPVVRIDNAGQSNASGLLRAGGLILDEDSPADVREGDVLEPMVRKNDRDGDPFIIGPIDWAYLVVTKVEDRGLEMDYYSGRGGGLQGRKNPRTFRMALKVRPTGESTTLRLHRQGDPDFPLIGYELYERELKAPDMTFVGRTNWDGRLEIEKTDHPFRLLYVKNGGAVLARLPIVPGLTELEVADLSGDDVRLQAEAYIRGVQNSIIDLVAIRELFKARIRLRLERGEMEKAETLMEALRQQPSNEALATDMGKRQAAFIKELGSRNANQRRKVDEMFTTTRELLAKHINPRMVRELEADLIRARENGGKLPKEETDEDAEEAEE